jgi:hypothetical protein
MAPAPDEIFFEFYRKIFHKKLEKVFFYLNNIRQVEIIKDEVFPPIPWK